MSGLEYQYYETRRWGWLYLYRGQEVTCLYFSNPRDINKYLYRLGALQATKIKRVEAADVIYKDGRRHRRLTPHSHDFINQVH